MRRYINKRVIVLMKGVFRAYGTLIEANDRQIVLKDYESRPFSKETCTIDQDGYYLNGTGEDVLIVPIANVISICLK